MLKPLALLTVLFSLLLAAPAGAVIVPGKGMAGAKLGECIEDVVAKLGPPDKTFGKTEPTGEFVETYTYDTPAIKIRFFRGPGECLVAGEFFTAASKERTAEGVGKRTSRRILKKRLKHVKCETFRQGKRKIRSCHIGRFEPAKRVTEFRMTSKWRVGTISVRVVSD
jgi:hypothetical protein